MKNRMVQTRTFTMFTARLVAIFLFAALLSAAPFHAALAQTTTYLGSAESFAALAGTAVTLTNSVVDGDVGVATGGAVTVTLPSTVSGTVYNGIFPNTYADAAYADFLAAYDALADVECDKYLTTAGGNLAGLVLTPGVYCIDGASTTTGGVLTLAGSSDDEWIFKIGSVTGALTGTNFTVVMSSGETCNNNVYWWVAQAVTLTDSVFIGSILAGADITITRGSLDGQVLAGGAGTIEVPTGAVTLSGAAVSVCGTTTPPSPPPILHPAIKVTGGGQIAVPDPNSTGRATFGFNAQPDKMGGAKGHFNYVNHVTGLHVNGPVDYIRVIAINPDGSPKTVLFSGIWTGGAFFVTVEDIGEPGWYDEFGVTVTGALPDEVTSQRIISRGNIQFHENPPMVRENGKK